MPDDASSNPRPELPPDASIDQIESDIAQTRNELGETVNALSAKADVTGRAKRNAKEKVATVKRSVPVEAVVAGAVLAVIGLVLVRRRRRRR